MLRKGWLVLCWLALSVSWFSATPTPTHAETFDGRTYSLFLPSTYTEASSLPLVVVLHDFAASGKGMEAITGFDALAEQAGFMVVYPDSATTFGWNDGRVNAVPGIEQADDVDYLLRLLDELSTQYAIDSEQIYLAGFAAGGAMAVRLACEAPERFAKVMTVGALLWDFQTDTYCTSDGAPVELLNVIGTKDPYYPLSGRRLESNPPMWTLSAEKTAEYWTQRNGCAGDEGQAVGNATLYCADTTPYIRYQLEGLGHNWARVGDYQLNQFGIDFTQLAWQYFSGQDIDWALATNTVVNEGAPRNYSLYVPPTYDSTTPTPLVIALHGRPDNGYSLAFLLDMNRVAREEGFIVVYPDGLDKEWNYTRGFEQYSASPTDDVAFLETLVEDLSVDLNIDTARVYVTGFSNGGFMTQRVACEGSDTFAAYAVIGATLFPGFVDLCADSRPVPILFMHGTADPSIPWGGIKQGQVSVAYSVPDTLSFWATHNGCSPSATEITEIPATTTDTKVSLFAFGGCTEGTRVDLYVIENGGHVIPGVAGRMDVERFGLVTPDLDAPSTIWAFFEEWTLPEE